MPRRILGCLLLFDDLKEPPNKHQSHHHPFLPPHKDTFVPPLCLDCKLCSRIPILVFAQHIHRSASNLRETAVTCNPKLNRKSQRERSSILVLVRRSWHEIPSTLQQLSHDPYTTDYNGWTFWFRRRCLVKHAGRSQQRRRGAHRLSPGGHHLRPCLFAHSRLPCCLVVG